MLLFLDFAINSFVQVLDMKEMRLHKRVGLFHVDITQFQKDCLPFPEKVLEAVSRHLPVIAARRNDVLLNVIKVSFYFYTSTFCFFHHFLSPLLYSLFSLSQISTLCGSTLFSHFFYPTTLSTHYLSLSLLSALFFYQSAFYPQPLFLCSSHALPFSSLFSNNASIFQPKYPRPSHMPAFS